MFASNRVVERHYLLRPADDRRADVFGAPFVQRDVACQQTEEFGSVQLFVERGAARSPHHQAAKWRRGAVCHGAGRRGSLARHGRYCDQRPASPSQDAAP